MPLPHRLFESQTIQYWARRIKYHVAGKYLLSGGMELRTLLTLFKEIYLLVSTKEKTQVISPVKTVSDFISGADSTVNLDPDYFFE